MNRSKSPQFLQLSDANSTLASSSAESTPSNETLPQTYSPLTICKSDFLNTIQKRRRDIKIWKQYMTGHNTTIGVPESIEEEAPSAPMERLRRVRFGKAMKRLWKQIDSLAYLSKPMMSHQDSSVVNSVEERQPFQRRKRTRQAHENYRWLNLTP